MQEVTIKKDPTIKLEEDIIEFLNPRFIFLPIKEGFKLKVRDEEYVYKNDIVAMDREGHMVHSSISGRVLGVKEMPYYNNKSYPSLVIENDFKENMRVRKSAKKYISTYTKKELLRVLKDTSLFYKGNYLSDKIDIENRSIIINGMESEPYFENKCYTFKKKLDELLETIDLLGTITKSKRTILVIKNNESLLINELMSLIGTYPNIELKLANDAYPNGISELLKTKFSLEDAQVFDIAEISMLYETIKREIPITEKYITITGTSVKPRSIVKVKIGSLLSEAFINHFNFTEKEVDVYLNGIMSGELVNSLKIVIDTDIEGILVLKKEKEETERCIKCGLCSKNCPVGLNPKYVYDHKGLVKKEYYDTCIKCGLCSYLCPSNIDLKKAMKECDKP